MVHPSDETIAAPTARRLLVELARTQRSSRLPSLAAGVTRGGRLIWSGGRGSTGSGEPGPHTQYRIGSITKPMTAVLVLRLRAEGLLDLDDPIGRYLPDLPIPERTVAQLLAHESGLRAELPAPPGDPAGHWWERVPGIGWDEFVARLRPHDVLSGPGRRFHYSNTGYAVLGELVARLRGRSWFEALRAEVLEPLGMTRTTYHRQAPAATGWAVHPWADLVLPEPEQDLGVGAAAGQLWSTVHDLGRFAGLLLGEPYGQPVLGPAGVAEMCSPTGVDVGAGRRGHGLGVFSYQRPGGEILGHGGSVPGHVAGLFVDPAERTAAVVATNSTNGGDSNALAMRLLDLLREHEPYLGPTWTPAPAVPEQVLELTGAWYWGPHPMAVRLSADGQLGLGGLAGDGRDTTFGPDGEGGWRGLNGYFAGERLSPVRTGDGALIALDVATYVLTRRPYDPAAPVPGGVDPAGWRPSPPSAGA